MQLACNYAFASSVGKMLVNLPSQQQSRLYRVACLCDPNQSENMRALYESLLPGHGPTEPAGQESTHIIRSDKPRGQESTLNTSTNEPDEQESTPYNSTNERRPQPEGQESTSDDSTNQPEEQGPKHGDDDISDPFKLCYHCGCNADTRSENLGCIALWFQDVPMFTIIIAVLYALSQTTCRVPDNRDVTPFLRDIAISATAATLSLFLETHPFVLPRLH